MYLYLWFYIFFFLFLVPKNALNFLRILATSLKSLLYISRHSRCFTEDVLWLSSLLFWWNRKSEIWEGWILAIGIYSGQISCLQIYPSCSHIKSKFIDFQSLRGNNSGWKPCFLIRATRCLVSWPSGDFCSFLDVYYKTIWSTVCN